MSDDLTCEILCCCIIYEKGFSALGACMQDHIFYISLGETSYAGGKSLKRLFFVLEPNLDKQMFGQFFLKSSKIWVLNLDVRLFETYE